MTLEKKREIILVGGGGHAKVLSEIIQIQGEYRIAGIVDPQFEPGVQINGMNVLGDDDVLPGLISKGIQSACNALGSVKSNRKRQQIYELLKRLDFSLPPIIHPRAIVSGMDTDIAEGVQVLAGATVQAGSKIGYNTIINTGAIVEHDCIIGEHVHICPGAIICGGSVIGDNSFVGAGSTVIQGMDIGKDTLIAAGTTVRQNIDHGMRVKE